MAKRAAELDKRAGHIVFDRLWKSHNNPEWFRSVCYWWLAEQMGMTRETCRFANFTEEQAVKAIRISRSGDPRKISHWWRMKKNERRAAA